MLRRALPAFLLLNVACGAPAPATAPKRFSIEQVRAANPLLTPDPNVKTGKLPNGLTYYILPNRKPEKRAALWLAVNAGSVQEDEDQHGLAHFVEHMAFNGTRRFPKHEIIDFLERSGSRFGADVNATTSSDETIYKLQLATDRPELMGRGLMVLRDFADGVTFDPAEVEKERGVILEEWRGHRGAGTRIADRHEAEMSHASAYVTHKPIGNPETIKGAPANTISRFYRDWYRPDLMAVIAVGDFDAAAIEAKIKLEFESIANPATERERKPIKLRFSDKTGVTIDTDPELNQVRVELDSLVSHRPFESVTDFRRSLGEQLWNAMLNSRLDEIARRPDAPFLSAATTMLHPVRPYDNFRQWAFVREDGVQEGVAALYRELLRVQRHGFTPPELERAKANILRNATRRAGQSDNRDTGQLVNQLARSFTSETVPENPAANLALVTRLLPQIDLAEVNKVSEIFAKGRQINISGPPSMARPTEDAVRATLLSVVTSNIPAYQDTGPTMALMAHLPTPSPVGSTNYVAELGVTEWKLPNGVRVLVKPTGTTNDIIRMGAFSPGGTSLVPDADFDSARFAAEIVQQGGVGPLDESALRKSLAGKVVSLGVGIEELQETLNGSASIDDVETLLQLVHLSFTAPRRDENAFAAWRARQIASIKTRQLSPEAAFAEELAVFSTQNNPRRRPPSADTFQHVNLEKAISIYRDRFSDAGDFTFVFVGNIDLPRLKALSETYLASLPATGRKETWTDPNVSMPSGVQKKVFTHGREPKSKVSITFHGPDTWTPAVPAEMSILSEVLNIRLREVLREEMGGTYHVSVAGSVARRPRQEYSLNVSFGCAPENVDKLVQAVFDETARLQEKGVDNDTIARVRELRRRSHETQLNDDGWWLKRIEYIYSHGDDPKPPPPSEPVGKASDRIRASAKKYLDRQSYLLGILNPQR